MKWFKDVIIDVAVTALIAVAVLLDQTWARWIVMIYTPVMIMLKGIALTGGSIIGLAKKKKEQPPDWFFHLLYAADVVLLLYGRLWLMAVAWAAIWILSVWIQARDRKLATTAATGRPKAKKPSVKTH